MTPSPLIGVVAFGVVAVAVGVMVLASLLPKDQKLADTEERRRALLVAEQDKFDSFGWF